MVDGQGPTAPPGPPGRRPRQPSPVAIPPFVHPLPAVLDRDATPLVTAGRTAVGHRVRGHSRPGTARADHRPSRFSTATATPNADETGSSRSTSPTGPAATIRPARRRAAWVTPAGISSRWWVTSTSGGTDGSAARPASRSSRRSRRAEVQPRGRLVHEHELGTCHEGAGQQDLLPLALGEQTEEPLGEGGPTEPGFAEQGRGLPPVGGRVFVPPRLECRVPAGEHRVEGRQLGPEGAGDRGTHHRDPAAQLPHVDPAEPLAEDLHDAAGRPEGGACDAQEGGLPRAVGPEQRPPLTGRDHPRDPVDDRGAATHH